MTIRSQCLQEVNQLLQELIDDITASAEQQDWDALQGLDLRVNELVRACVADGHIGDPSIHRKVMFIAGLYREVIASLAEHRDATLAELNEGKQLQKVNACYQAASSACA